MSDSINFLDGVLQSPSCERIQSSGVLPLMQALQPSRFRPIMLICETINICNADCVFCPYGTQTRDKGTMSMELFKKVLDDYRALGGGYFSMTPMVGDVLLDKQLSERVQLLERYRPAISASITTNLYALDRHTDAQILAMLECFNRIHISTYGLDEEECNQITRRNHFKKYVAHARRLTELWKQSSRSCEIVVGFRVAHEYTQERLDEFVLATFGHQFWCGGTSRYANWGNSVSGTLPADAQWVPPRENHSTCVLLLVAMQVYWDGRVSACACCDYDAGKELHLGDVNRESLLEIYNGARNRKIWIDHESGHLPKICRNCTFHQSLDVLSPTSAIATKITDFIGG